MQADKDGLDQPFEDYAWSQMSTLLDQELPVQEEKKRRWLFLLLLFLGLSVGGVTVYQVFQGEEKETVKRDRPIAESEILDNEQLDKETLESRGESQDELWIEKKNSVARNEIISPKSITSNQIEQDRTRSNQAAVDHRLSTVDREKNSNVVSNNSNDQILSTDSQISISQSPILNSESSINDQQITNSLSSQSINPSIHQPFDPLPTVRSMNMSPIEPITSATRSITTEPVVRKLSKWELAARLGGIATLDGKTHLTLGTDVQYHFKPKWSVRSGASWIATEQNKLFSFNTTGDATSMLEDMNTPNNGSGNRFSQEADLIEGEAAIRDSIVCFLSPRHHFLSIPLSIEYRIGNRFSTYGGVQILLAFNSGNSAYEEQLATTATNAVGTVPYTQQKGLFDTDPIRASWQWHTGVHFRATERFSYDFSYHHILPKQRSRNHLEQYLELGLRYNIFSP